MVDLAFLEKFTKGDALKMKRYITMYLDSSPKVFEEMEQNIQNKNWDQLRIHAHSLKPQAEFMGIENLRSILEEIEKSVNNNSYDTITALHIKASKLQFESEIFLRNFIGKI